MQLGDTTESTDLTQLDSFVGPPGTGAPMAQVRGGLQARQGARMQLPLGSPSPASLGLDPPSFDSFGSLAPACASAQPFQVIMDRQALLVMDFHAHLR
jgi:hypothetical protein